MISKKQFDIFVTLRVCLANGHRPMGPPPRSSCRYQICGLLKSDWKDEGIERAFQKDYYSFDTRPIPSLVRFDGSRITACNASDSLILRIEQDVKLQGRGATISKGDTIILWVEPIYFETLLVNGCSFLLSFQCHRIDRFGARQSFRFFPSLFEPCYLPVAPTMNELDVLFNNQSDLPLFRTLVWD